MKKAMTPPNKCRAWSDSDFKRSVTVINIYCQSLNNLSNNTILFNTLDANPPIDMLDFKKILQKPTIKYIFKVLSILSWLKKTFQYIKIIEKL